MNAPELLERVKTNWEKRRADLPGLKRLEDKLEKGTATYKEADQYAVAVGDSLAKAYAEEITADLLPDGHMDKDTANTVVRPTLEQDHAIIAAYAEEVQRALNEGAGLGLNPVVPVVDQNRIQGLIDRIAEAEDYNSISWILGEPVRNFSQNVVDETVRKNFEYQGNSGLSPKIIRTAEAPGTRSIKRGKKTYTYKVPCKWCAGLAGTYWYSNGGVEPMGNYTDATYDRVNRDIYRRHEGCRCTIEYSPDGVRRQNVHTKKWSTAEELAERKNYGKDDRRITPAERLLRIPQISASTIMNNHEP